MEMYTNIHMYMHRDIYQKEANYALHTYINTHIHMYKLNEFYYFDLSTVKYAITIVLFAPP